MLLPSLSGEVERRLLVTYRVDPDVVARLLPARFRPQVRDGAAVAGICLIRLGGLRPRGFPARVGLRSENAAHRVAVEWDSPDGPQTGVYIPRRDTASRLTAAVGGRLFPGEHHLARFDVREDDTSVAVSFTSRDGSTRAAVEVEVADELTGSALFADLAEASAFFERGAVGWSATHDPDRVDGLELRTDAWRVDPVTVRRVESSLFDDPHVFPVGSAEPDCALLMRHVPVTWHAVPAVRAPSR